MRVLALDYGSARCGCALSDPTGAIVTPIEPIFSPATRRGLRSLEALIRERDVERVVVGLPLSLSGQDTSQTSEARAFARRLADRLGGFSGRAPAARGERSPPPGGVPRPRRWPRGGGVPPPRGLPPPPGLLPPIVRLAAPAAARAA